MKIRIRKPVYTILTQVWPINQKRWEEELSRWLRVKVTLPRFFWEIYQPYLHKSTPRHLTVECQVEDNWLSVFYSYNLKHDMEKFIEVAILRNTRKLFYQLRQNKSNSNGSHRLSA